MGNDKQVRINFIEIKVVNRLNNKIKLVNCVMGDPNTNTDNTKKNKKNKKQKNKFNTNSGGTSTCNNNINEFIWMVNGVKYSEEQVRGIQGISNCFVYINKNKLYIDDYAFYEGSPFQLGKDTGIKFHSNRQDELKVIKLTLIHKSDIRYIAKKVYKNKYNNYLMVFDEETDHQKIEDMVRESGTKTPQIKIINV